MPTVRWTTWIRGYKKRNTSTPRLLSCSERVCFAGRNTAQGLYPRNEDIRKHTNEPP